MERARLQGTDDRVLAGRINTLISQQPIALAAQVVLAVLLAVVLSENLPHRWLAVWVLTVWGITAWRGVIWFRHRGGLVTPSNARSVGTAMAVVATLSGAVWGVPGGLFFPAEPGALQGFFVFVLGGMSAAAVGNFVQIHAQTIGCRLAQHQRSARGGVDLVVVVGFDDLDVVVHAQGL